MLRNEGLRIVDLTASGTASAGETYGRFSDGTARKLALARGVEHIGVLYSHDSMVESLRWLNAALGKQLPAFFEAYASGDPVTLGRFLAPGAKVTGLGVK